MKKPARKRESFLIEVDQLVKLKHAALDAKKPLPDYIAYIVNEHLLRLAPPPINALKQGALPGVERNVSVHRVAYGAPRRAHSLSPLPEDPSWLLRLLWALEHARRENLPPQTGADLTRILNEEGGQAVHSPNTSRKLRELRRNDEHQECWRTIGGDRFAITPVGQALLNSLLREART